MSKKPKNKGKRDGTPEISGSPANEMLMEDEAESAEKKPVIVDEEILSLAIKNEDLSRLRGTMSPAMKDSRSKDVEVVVRKSKQLSGKENLTPKKVVVARPAPVDAPLEPTQLLGAAGARFDESGIILPHSILGSVENYIEEATCSGQLPTDVAKQQLSHVLPVKFGQSQSDEKAQKRNKHPKMESVSESNALKNWQVRMAERRKQQGYLSKLLGKPVESLVMNQADSYRDTQEMRHLIDRAMAAVDYGKGYRVGSEFWKQHENIGHDIGGVKITPGQAERGYPRPIEHIGVPKTILREKGSKFVKPPSAHKKPWHKTEYLEERKTQFQSIIDELSPYNPDLLNLEIIGEPTASQSRATPDIMTVHAEYNLHDLEEEGCSPEYESAQESGDCLSSYPDVYPEPVFGPSIKFAGQSARWTGDSVQFKDQVGIEARISFEAYETRRTTSHLEVVNDGTTCIYYSWKKKPHKSPFDIVHSKVQRFYFDSNDGVILPGDTCKFPFVFKSPNAGVFMESWEFQTHPTVLGGATLLVTLRGIALQEDKLKAARSGIEEELAKRQAVQIVKNVLYNLVSGIRTPERPSSPVDAHMTDEEIFKQKNGHLKYHSETVQQLQELYLALFQEEEKDVPPWDLDITSLKQLILAMDEEDDRKQEFLHRINMAAASLSFPTFLPVQGQMYSVCYQLLANALDEMVDGCQKTRDILGIPDPQDIDSAFHEVILRKRDSKSAKQENKDKDSKDAKDKKAGKKEEKSVAKSSSKESSRGKITPAPQKRPSSPQKVQRASTSDERTETDLSEQETETSLTNSSSIDPLLQSKYRDIIYVHAYSVMANFCNQISEALADIKSKNANDSED